MYRRHAPLLVTIFLLCGIEFLQTGMIAFASLPIMGEIGAGPEEYSLVAALYACMAVVSISKQRWFTERLGWRNYVLASAGVFIAGALICSQSDHLLSFTVGRVVMGLGGGGFMTAGRVLINELSPGPERFTGIKVFATALAGGTAASPFLAAMVVTHDDWHSIFWILIGIALLTCAMATVSLSTDRHPPEERTSSSALRAGMLAIGAFTLPYAIQRTPYEFYSAAPAWLGLVVAGLLILYVFFHVEHQHDRPLLHIRNLITSRYVAGVALFCFCYLVVGANSYMLPIFLQRGLGFSWETIGTYQSASLVAAVATWFVMAKLIPRSPAPRKYLIVGFLALAGFGYRLSSLSPQADMVDSILPALALNGCFLMLVLPTAAMQTFRDVPPDTTLSAHAQQIKNMFGQIATAAGTAVGAVVLQWRSTVQYGVLNVHSASDDPTSQHQLAAAAGLLERTTGAVRAAQIALAQQAQDLAQQATLVASIEYFRVLAMVATLALAISAVQRIFR
jgi:MFS family permease